ncbi:MAG TPA: protein kinase, partial [Pirellulales bacterium]|nr:protein kinase [Pirellulales bacterium]
DLIYNELLLAEELGQPVDVQDYCRRFPQYAERLKRQLEVRRLLDGQRLSDASSESLLRSSGDGEEGSRQENDSEFLGTERFTVLRRLGKGGMGTVYLAFDNFWQQRVALKTFRRADAGEIFRLKHEFRVLEDLSHPNLVQFFELFSADDRYFFTMELVDGGDFLSYCRRSGKGADGARVHEPSVRNALTQLASGLIALHSAGLLHCDIKPSNVLVTLSGRVVLLDFGLTRTHQWELEASPGYLQGTAAYMAPEQFRGERASPASDWYGVGVMLFAALANRLPFTGTVREILAAKSRRDPPSLQELNPEAPADLSRLASELLERDPARRPTGEEVLRRLGVREDRRAGTGTASAFVGRQQELQRIQEAFARAAGGQTVALLLHGGSGSGKSALAERFAASLDGRQDVLLLSGRCYQRESVPFKAIDRLVDQLSQTLRSWPADEVRELLPDETPLLAAMFPVLQRAPAVAGFSRSSPSSVDPQMARRAALRSFRELLTRISRRATVVLLIDDLQLSDRDSVDLLTELLGAENSPPLLLLACYRCDEGDLGLVERIERIPATERRCIERLAVNDLSEQDARALAVKELGLSGQACSEDANMLVRESGGNPFLLLELAWQMRTHRRGSTGPEQADEILWNRVRRLPERAQRLLTVIAVAGHPLAPTEACQAARVMSDRQKVFQGLLGERFVRNWATVNGADLTEPYHDRLRDVVLSRVSEEERRQHHMNLALALEANGGHSPDRLAWHYHYAGRRAPACEFATLAADRAAEALAFEKAAELYRLALENQPGGTAGEAALRRRLADALANAGRPAEAGRAYCEAAECCGEDERLGLLRNAADQFLRGGQLEEGESVFRGVLGDLGLRIPKTRRRALIDTLVQRTRFRMRQLRVQYRDPNAMSQRVLDRIDICWTAGTALAMIDPIYGLCLQPRCTRLSLDSGEAGRIARALALEAAMVCWADGRKSRRAKALVDLSLAAARRADDPHATAYVDMLSGYADFCSGDWQAAIGRFVPADATFRTRCSGCAWELGVLHAWIGQALFYLGEFEQLSQRVRSMLSEAEQRGDLFCSAMSRLANCNAVWLVEDNPAEARRNVESAMAAWHGRDFSLQHILSEMALVQADLYQRRGNDAWQRAEAFWRPLAASGMLRQVVMGVECHWLRARAALAALDRGRSRRALLRTAECDARYLERKPFEWCPAVARVVRAAIAFQSGDRAQAASWLAESARQLDDCSMPLLAAVCRYRFGQLLGAEAGRQVMGAVQEWMQDKSIAAPGAMAAMLAPGFDGE